MRAEMVQDRRQHTLASGVDVGRPHANRGFVGQRVPERVLDRRQRVEHHVQERTQCRPMLGLDERAELRGPRTPRALDLGRLHGCPPLARWRCR